MSKDHRKTCQADQNDGNLHDVYLHFCKILSVVFLLGHLSFDGLNNKAENGLCRSKKYPLSESDANGVTRAEKLELTIWLICHQNDPYKRQ